MRGAAARLCSALGRAAAPHAPAAEAQAVRLHSPGVPGVPAMVGCLALAAVCCAYSQVPAAVDPSLHRVTFVAIRADVHLEVLDWGGHGPAVVFLAGFGDTAHVFDGFAPQFTDRFHVFGITRRGFGASSRPAGGYDSRTLAQDIILVLDSLRLSRAAFVGHSFAGTELSYLGAFYGGRVTQLVYLDAS